MNSQGERLAMETYLERARKVRENQCLHLNAAMWGIYGDFVPVGFWAKKECPNFDLCSILHRLAPQRLAMNASLRWCRGAYQC
jgi:hypothetical protein